MTTRVGDVQKFMFIHRISGRSLPSVWWRVGSIDCPSKYGTITIDTDLETDNSAETCRGQAQRVGCIHAKIQL